MISWKRQERNRRRRAHANRRFYKGCHAASVISLCGAIMSNIGTAAVFKVIMLGPSAAGKTTAIEYYETRDSVPAMRQQPTVGVDFRVIHRTVNGRMFSFQMWDTAGQERFRAIVSTYYRQCHAIIGMVDLAHMVAETARLSEGSTVPYTRLVADVVHEQTENIRVAVETNVAQHTAPLVLILANKIDLLGTGIAPTEVAERNELARVAVEEFRGSFNDVSALRGTGIVESFETLFRALVAKWERQEQTTRAASISGRPLAPDFTLDAESMNFPPHNGGCAC